MSRIITPEADAILDEKVAVLDHGFVALVDYMGGDRRIAEAAWVSSFDERKAEEKTDKAVRKIINYMLANGHTSPFEQVVLTFRCKMPIFVARQWIRHRTARLNEMSGRYRILPHEAYVPTLERLTGAGKGVVNKQGSEGEIDGVVASNIRDNLYRAQTRGYSEYDWLSGTGLANELARINLPLSQYTEWYWQIDLHNLFNFLRLRLDAHAQWEIQQYGKVMAEMTKKVAPMAWEAFEEHQLGAMTFSKRELSVLRASFESYAMTGQIAQGDDEAVARKVFAKIEGTQ